MIRQHARLARTARRLVHVIAMVFLPLTAASGQPSAVAATPGSELEIYLMTMGPGSQIWERFGHNALGIRDRSTGTDIVYNWGTFSFSQAGFLPRFLRGQMNYWVQSADAMQTIAEYQYFNRSVWIQELDLTPATRLAVKAFVERNALEANKFYRYDYFRDNCSTRVRDVLDFALGGRLKSAFAAVPSGLTYRDEARRLMQPDKLTYTGIEIGLGAPSDAPMSRFDAFYIPMRLRDGLREVRDPITGRQLVRAETTVFEATRPQEAAVASSYFLRYFGFASLLALAILTLGRRGEAAGGQGAATSWATAVAITWCVVSGLLGLLLVGLWGLTEHVFAHRNVNLLLLNPLWFALIPRVRSSARHSLSLLWLVGGLAVVGTVLGLLRVPQRSEHVVALVAPVHAAVLTLIAMRRRRGA